MYNGLVRIKPGQATPAAIEPDLAESWTTSPDGLTWTFKLRQGVDCHGKYGEFDAEDAVFSLKRAAAKESSSFAKDYAALQTIQATGKYEVKIVPATPHPQIGRASCRERVCRHV